MKGLRNVTYSMMKALFGGKVIPWERRNTHSAERVRLEARIEDERQYFASKLPLDDHKRFKAFVDMFGDATYDEEIGIYAHGFTLGALLMLEVMEKKGAIINE